MMRYLFNTLVIKMMAASGNFGSSEIATGTMNLLQDLLSWLYLLIPVAGALCVAYFCVRRGHSDEQDKKQWTNRIQTAIVSTVIGLLATAVINLVVGYFK